MATAVIMPRQGQSVESCIISKWFKHKGDAVTQGEVLFSYETDKAAFEEEAPVDGTILAVLFPEGEDVPVLTNVCVIGKEGEDISAFLTEPPVTPGEGEPPSIQPAVPQMEERSQAQPTPSVGLEGVAAAVSAGIKISPRARRMAAQIGLNPHQALPTGPEGRIIERDILALSKNTGGATPSAMEAYSAAGEAVQGTGIGGRVTTWDLERPAAAPNPAGAAPAEAEYEEIKHSNIRRVIARTMHQSLSNTAQLTLHASFDATEILNYRKQLKAGQEALGLQNITLNDMVLYAVSRTLPNHPALNAHYYEDRMLVYRHVHLGIAVDTDRGLMVPTLQLAEQKSLNQISGEVKSLAKACQEGSVNPDALKGATFTITNLGALDIEVFTPVLNPPQTGILGVNTIVYRMKEQAGEMVSYPSMGLSLTFDHRALDGAPAARFLKELKANLESFTLLLSK